MSVKRNLAEVRGDEVIPNVMRATEDIVGKYCVALYQYGSTAKGRIDGWSDIDVLLVRDPSEEGLEKSRRWMSWVYEKYQHLVDPIALSELALVCGTDTSIAGFVWALKIDAIFLLGRDIRDQLPWPSVEAMQRTAVEVAVLSVRRLYMISHDAKMPRVVPAYQPRMSGACLAGNWAWQLVTATHQLSRAIIALNQGRLCTTKDALSEAVNEIGDAALASALAAAACVRARVPRWGDLAEGCGITDSLATAIPFLYARLIKGINAKGMLDMPCLCGA
jgi:predicted nucleotidyltransferase